MVKHTLEKFSQWLAQLSCAQPNEYSLVELVDEEGVEEVALGEAPKLAQSCIALLTRRR